MGTGKVAYGSDLIRKKWMREGLVQKAATSFWAPYKGTTKDSIIMQANLESADTGHTVVFDMDGNLSGRPVKGNTTAKGTGEQKKKFSDKLTVTDYRYVVDNGTAFDGKEIGDLSITAHEDSRSKLTDLWTRSSDQSYFDLAQQGAQFGIDLGTTFTFDQILDIEKVVKKGKGFTASPAGISSRLPLKPFMLQDGKPVWLFVVDVAMKTMLLKSTGAQQTFRDADIRGNENRVIKGVIGKVGNFLFVEGDDFFGTTSGSILDANGYYQYDQTGVEMAGLRQRDIVNNKWSGETGFVDTATQKSRGVILGAGAFQFASGKMPDYKFEGTDFNKFSESAMEVWCAAKNTKLIAENTDNAKAKIAGYNFGSIYVDVTTQA